MRLIWSTDQVDLARKFSAILQAKKIDYMQEEVREQDWGTDAYGNRVYRIWTHEEDQIPLAKELLESFLKSPDAHPIHANDTKAATENASADVAKRILDKKLQFSFKKEPKPPSSPFRATFHHFRLSNFLIVLCSVILLMCEWTEKKDMEIPAAARKVILTTSPVEKTLLFDYPESFELADTIAALYGYNAFVKPNDLPPLGKLLYENYKNQHPWQGIYPLLLSKDKNHAHLVTNTVMFEKIRQGEVWRLVTPVFLHADILHLFFNMIWLLLIGTQIEARIGWLRFLSFIVITAIISNVSQYLVTGCAFIGFSGVVCAMVFFVRARQKIAPWEGYQMPAATFQFILFFIGALATLSLLAFALELLQIGTFPVAIANTAHIVGALAGYLLGRYNFFPWQGTES